MYNFPTKLELPSSELYVGLETRHEQATYEVCSISSELSFLHINQFKCSIFCLVYFHVDMMICNATKKNKVKDEGLSLVIEWGGSSCSGAIPWIEPNRRHPVVCLWLVPPIFKRSGSFRPPRSSTSRPTLSPGNS